MSYAMTTYTDEDGNTFNQAVISAEAYWALGDAELKALMLPLVAEHELYCGDECEVLEDYLWLEACFVVKRPTYPLVKDHAHLYSQA